MCVYMHIHTHTHNTHTCCTPEANTPGCFCMVCRMAWVEDACFPAARLRPAFR